MNCTKCGKEIPEGENKVCEDCQKIIQEEIVSEEKIVEEALPEEKAIEETVSTEANEPTEEAKETETAEEKVADEKETEENEKETTDEVTVKEEKPEKKFEVSKEKEDGKKGIKVEIILLIIIAVALVVLCCVKFSNGSLEIGTSRVETRIGDNVGNTIGNIRNYGYGTIQKNWIYYIAPNEEITGYGIFKVKTDGTDNQELFMQEDGIVSLNINGDYLYFISMSSETNKIYKIKTDGTELTLLNDTDVDMYCYEIYVVNNNIYYFGADYDIYKMDLKGENKTLVSDTKTGYLGITDKYIIYNQYIDEESSEIETYIMDLKGENKKPLVEGERTYSTDIQGNYVYYTNEGGQICRVKIGNASSKEVLHEITAYNVFLNSMNVLGNYIYYMDIENETGTVCIYKIKADGTDKEPTMITELKSYSIFLNILDDWILYMDGDDQYGYINLIKADGSKEVELFKVDISEIPDNTEYLESTAEDFKEYEGNYANSKGETITLLANGLRKNDPEDMKITKPEPLGDGTYIWYCVVSDEESFLGIVYPIGVPVTLYDISDPEGDEVIEKSLDVVCLYYGQDAPLKGYSEDSIYYKK